DAWNDAPGNKKNAIRNFMYKLKYTKEKIQGWLSTYRLNSRGALAKLKEDLRMFDEAIDKGNSPVEMVHKRLETLNKIQQRDDLESMVMKEEVKKAVWDCGSDKSPERRYPLTRFTLDQMLNNMRLEVEEESEVSLELLRRIFVSLTHGQAKVKSWKLLESCGVYIITFTTTQLILLVERRYPLSRFTLDQMLNALRLRVEEQTEMSLELLRFTRQ
nr:RNA-directed DNA polymerase, eukaryota [Tanacetum cinerariifolium]